ncbi:MAG TPA: DNA recombination protein RmuC [Thermoleophilaceae bacterium]|nr:DNA recombination protein RmuC [Thermoleophilaceae bacterium]
MEQLWLLIGLALGAGAVYLVMRGRVDHERRAAEARVGAVTQAKEDLSNQFTALSTAALEQNNARFLQLAEQRLKEQQTAGRTELETQKRDVKQLVKPVEEKLEAVSRVLREMEKERAEAYGGLNRQLVEVTATQQRLHAETANLVTALRAPHVRGRWGEVQLKRVCEMAGMLAYCDFYEQQSVTGENGVLRPDVVVKLPGGKDVVVDAKAPLAAYLDAIEAKDEATREAHLDTYARHVREHIQKLSAKSYSAQFESSPEFVVMFLPGEVFYSAALERMPNLIEQSVEEQVLIATPTTLIALLKAVAYGWRQERMAESAREVTTLGRELYQRLSVLSDRFVTLGRRLDSSVKAYNETVGTLESRVLVSARKFDDHGVAPDGAELASPAQVDIAVRRIQAREADSPAAAGELPAVAEDLL